MPTCFTVSTLSPTHLFKFQVRFQVASWDCAPSHEQTRGCEYNAVHGKDIAAIDSSLCWSSTGELVTAQGWCSVLKEAGRGLRSEFVLLGCLSTCPTKSAISRRVSAEWKKSSMISAGAGGCSCGASSQPCCLPMCAGEGWFSWPDLSARAIFL